MHWPGEFTVGNIGSHIAPLSPYWAFLIQLRQGTPLSPQGIEGRVEHITSGQAIDFQTLDALLAFMQAVLDNTTEPTS